MAQYSPPLEDYRFAYEVLELGDVAVLPGLEEATSDLILQVIAEAGKFGEAVLLPINRQSDEIGAKFSDGAVTTPPGFKEAYQTFCRGGWPALTGPREYGGQGLPAYMGFILTEIISASCMAFGQYTGLTHGAAIAIEAHADERLKTLYLPKLISGEWSGTMCLTEPQAGTDLGLLRTRAQPSCDGGFKISGTKIFISAGEHDIAANIVHLVLARLPDAPPGVRGISLFIVPKFLPDAGGEAGNRNGVHCQSIEHKMGMKGAVACVMGFEGASGWLVGEPNKGLAAMFTMMNVERLLLSAQGQGAAETAYQSSVAYARDRLQGRAPSGPVAPDRPADPIIHHPDVRRMLLTMKSHAEGGRFLGLWVMKHVDVSANHPDPAERERAAAFVALMTPIVKVVLSENGSHAADLGIQVFGGHGYIREWGMEQNLRDIRILQLYEGANGIQALDLVSRKLPMEDGNLIHHLTDPIAEFLADNRYDPDIAEFTGPLEAALARLKRATLLMREIWKSEPDERAAAAMDYLKITGFLAQAFLFAKAAKHAIARNEENPAFHESKLATARFFFAKLLPTAESHMTSLEAGAAPVIALPVEAF